MFRFDIALNLIVLVILAVGLYFNAKRREGSLCAVYSVFFSAALFFAYLIKLNLPVPDSSVFLPFNKLIHIYEYNYADILRDILIYAVPYLAAGFFFRPAFPRSGIAASAIFGVMYALVANIYPLLDSGIFITDEYILAGLGMGAGCALYGLLAYAFRRKNIFNKLKLPLPRRRSLIFAVILWVVLYIAIALLLIFNFSRPYEVLLLPQSPFALPSKVELNCSFDKSESDPYYYAPSSTPLDQRLSAIARGVGIDAQPTFDAGVYTSENEFGKVTMTENGGWVYDSFETPAGALPTRESAVNAVFGFFAGTQLLSVEMDEVFDIVERTDSDTGRFCGFDVFISTSVDGRPIIDSSTVVATVRADNSIVKIRRYDGDIEPAGQVRGLSAEKAFAKLLNEPCFNTLSQSAQSAVVNDYELAYMKNDKGYYLPVWCFFCTAQLDNGSVEDFTACVRADK